MRKRTKNFGFFVLTIIFLFDILAWIAVWDLRGPRPLEVIFFNVGQGDAIFIETPKRHQILIDGGPDSSILEKLSQEMPFYDRSLDLVILTHPEIDHMIGLLEVLKRYKVDYILWTGAVKDTPEYKEWIKVLQNKKAQVKAIKAGQKVRFAENIYLDSLSPPEILEGKFMENTNDASIVARLVFQDKSFFFTGDISCETEEKLISDYNEQDARYIGRTARYTQLKSDVLKVAHHGSKYGSCDYFLEKVKPEIAVIQVGKNSYGHPTSEVLSRLEKFGIKIFRTDKDGDVRIISNGAVLKI